MAVACTAASSPSLALTRCPSGCVSSLAAPRATIPPDLPASGAPRSRAAVLPTVLSGRRRPSVGTEPPAPRGKQGRPSETGPVRPLRDPGSARSPSGQEDSVARRRRGSAGQTPPASRTRGPARGSSACLRRSAAAGRAPRLRACGGGSRLPPCRSQASAPGQRADAQPALGSPVPPRLRVSALRETADDDTLALGQATPRPPSFPRNPAPGGGRASDPGCFPLLVMGSLGLGCGRPEASQREAGSGWAPSRRAVGGGAGASQ